MKQMKKKIISLAVVLSMLLSGIGTETVARAEEKVWGKRWNASHMDRRSIRHQDCSQRRRNDCYRNRRHGRLYCHKG